MKRKRENIPLFDEPQSGGQAGAAASSGGAAAEAPEAKAAAKTEFNVKIVKFEEKAKLAIIKEVRAITGKGLKEVRGGIHECLGGRVADRVNGRPTQSKDLVESAPFVLKKDIKKEEAEELQKKFKELGAQVELE